MANRCPNPNLFASSAPPWLLSLLDQNSQTYFQGSFNDSSLGYVNGIPTDTGSANIYQVTLPFGTPSAYQAGMALAFIPVNANTGPSTITVSPLGSATIVNRANVALSGGEILKNKACFLVYDGTNFRIVSACGLYYGAVNFAGTLNINCAGYDSVCVTVQYTASFGTAVVLQALGQGTAVSVTYINSFGSNLAYGLSATTVTGANFTTVAGGKTSTLAGGTLFTFQQGATLNTTTINTGTMVALNGVAGAGVLYLG